MKTFNIYMPLLCPSNQFYVNLIRFKIQQINKFKKEREKLTLLRFEYRSTTLLQNFSTS